MNEKRHVTCVLLIVVARMQSRQGHHSGSYRKDTHKLSLRGQTQDGHLIGCRSKGRTGYILGL